MKNILCELFYGRYIPYENIAPKNHSEYMAIHVKINEAKNYFRNILTEDQYIRFEKLEAMYTESSGIEIESAYKAGFRLAVMIMADVYVGNDKPRECNIMDTIDGAEIQDIIDRLKDLAGDRESFFREDGDDEVFRLDHDALLKSIELLKLLKKVTV